MQLAGIKKGRCKLVVVAIETGGRWSVVQFCNVARPKSREAAPMLQRSAFLAGDGAGRAFAGSLTSPRCVWGGWSSTRHGRPV